jgi:hypothetical protein
MVKVYKGSYLWVFRVGCSEGHVRTVTVLGIDPAWSKRKVADFVSVKGDVSVLN